MILIRRKHLKLKQCKTCDHLCIPEACVFPSESQPCPQREESRTQSDMHVNSAEQALFPPPLAAENFRDDGDPSCFLRRHVS